MKISEEKKEKISEQILFTLYTSSPKPLFTYHIAQEIARDEEFVKRLLLDLKKKNFVVEIKKNPKGKDYLKKSKWILNNKIYSLYRKKQILEHP